MTFDEATVMAFVDGELDAITARRVERAAATDPALAAAIAAHRALGARLNAAFAGIAEAPVPDRLARLVPANVVPFPTKQRARWGWAAVTGIAACLLGVVVLERSPMPGSSPAGTVTGPLAQMLDTRLALATGDTRILLSFRNQVGTVCRVFAEPARDGIACRTSSGWALVRSQAGMPTTETQAYRQAASRDAALMAAAQDMMRGEPFDVLAERRAREKGWR